MFHNVELVQNVTLPRETLVFSRDQNALTVISNCMCAVSKFILSKTSHIALTTSYTLLLRNITFLQQNPLLLTVEASKSCH